MALTMDDVAKRARVSKATVSRVFRKPGVISDRTAVQVIRAAREIGYKPPQRKNSAKKKRKKQLSILVGFGSSLRKHITQNPTIVEIVHGIESEANGDVLVSIRSLGYDIVNSEEIKRDIPHELRDGRVDGMIVLGHAPNTLFDQLDQARIPFVSVEAEKGYSQANIIMPDHYSAGYVPTKYLIDLGHRKIAYAGCPCEFISIRQQILGYCDALTDAGIEENDNLIIRTEIKHYANLEVGKRVAERILSMESKPSAVIFGGEVDAADGLRFFQSKGLVVPTDISIISSGSTAMSICNSTEPHLTNMCCISDELLGRLAIKRLIEIINGTNCPSYKMTLPGKLVVGGSTAPPKL